MWRYSRATVQRWSHLLLHTHDTPVRTAAAVGLGVAIGFSPFVGFHVALGVILAFVLNLNRVAVIAGVWVNLPWVMGAYYPAATALGAWILQTRIPPHLMAQLAGIWALEAWGARLDGLVDLVRPLLWPFTLGSLIGAVVLGFLAYRVTLPMIVAHRRHLAAQAADSARKRRDKSLRHSN
jgi:uncharacterized protein (DUF2062 family)